MNGNREYKSDVFSMLMEDKKRALQLYNVMNGSCRMTTRMMSRLRRLTEEYP